VQGEFTLLCLGVRHAPGVDPVCVAATPLLHDQYLVDPVGGRCGQGVERGANRLAGQFETVQVTDGRHDVGGVGALPTALLDQTECAQPVHPVLTGLVSGLPVRQVRCLLQDGDQREPTRRPARPAPLPERVGELGVWEQFPEPVADLHCQRSLALTPGTSPGSP
jgi:hypothetical protein